jgi:hypothetical protein
MNDGNSGKLLFLRDRGKRPVTRSARRRSDSSKRPTGEGRTPAALEAVWLSRALWIVAAYYVLYWLAVALGVLSVAGDGGAQSWTVSLVVADVVVAILSVLGATELARTGEDSSLVFSHAAAGALLLVASVRLGHAAAASFDRDLVPSERLEIVAVVGCLVVGVWILSHSLRLRAAR